MKVYLDQGSFAKLETKETHVLIDNESLDLEFEGQYEMKNGIVRLKNGSIIETMKFQNSLTVPKTLLFSGYLTGVVEQYIDGILAKTWQIPPIMMRQETPGEIVAYDEILEIKKEIEKMKDKIFQIADDHFELVRKIKKHFEEVI